MQTIKANKDPYTPLILKDEFGNEYIALNKYEAGNIRNLMLALSFACPTLNSGDWFSDITTHIPVSWKGNDTVEQIISKLDKKEIAHV